MSGRLMRSASMPDTAIVPKHRDKVARVVIAQLAQDPGAGAAYSYQDQRHEDRDLNNLQRKSGWRKAGRID